MVVGRRTSGVRKCASHPISMSGNLLPSQQLKISQRVLLGTHVTLVTLHWIFVTRITRADDTSGFNGDTKSRKQGPVLNEAYVFLFPDLLCSASRNTRCALAFSQHCRLELHEYFLRYRWNRPPSADAKCSRTQRRVCVACCRQSGPTESLDFTNKAFRHGLNKTDGSIRRRHW